MEDEKLCAKNYELEALLEFKVSEFKVRIHFCDEHR